MNELDEPSFPAFFAGIPAVVALVQDRVFAQRIPQHIYSESTKMPCLVFQRIGGTRQVLHCGTDNLVEAIYQIDAYAPKYADAVRVATQARRALVGYGGPMGEVQVSNVFITADFDAEEPEPGLERRSQSYTVWYKEQP